jgi:hypothetical protein
MSEPPLLRCGNHLNYVSWCHAQGVSRNAPSGTALDHRTRTYGVSGPEGSVLTLRTQPEAASSFLEVASAREFPTSVSLTINDFWIGP